MKRHQLKDDVIAPAIFALYLYAVFKIILFKFQAIDFNFLWHQLQRNLGDLSFIKERLHRANFTPFQSISSNVQMVSSHNIINLYGNIALFIPYGIFLVYLAKKQRISFLGVFMRALALSLSLEILQVVFAIGSFDVDDLILNVFGSLIGCFAARLYRFSPRIFKVKSPPPHVRNGSDGSLIQSDQPISSSS
ncbi:hypothetical protein GCM10008018_38960 [Paenibacillus marchantiophytorum]|uniref:VanZ-like domain-containing protein n=1 Tax=Paenibacillus marchantiophytorum TaxID=1619310 RepID=A0ABQ1EVW6_9BACL|nr:VanZ family protein [Paenibacillus marchantiophytorum]GFZ89001.1 hypothetical protein GCM10008018_38960 [Paenibacillus marchantiophytorum]